MQLPSKCDILISHSSSEAGKTKNCVEDSALLIGDVVESVSRKDEWLTAHPPRFEWFGLSLMPSRVSRDHPPVKTFETAYNAPGVLEWSGVR